MRGRKAKPTAIKKLQGNPGKRPLNQHEPDPGRANLRTPARRMGKHAQRLWKDLAPVLDEIGVLKQTDLAALELMCDHYGFAVDAGEAMREMGAVTFDDKGNPRKNPYSQVFRENAAAFRAMAAEFGLTPSSRARLDVGEPEEASLAEALFQLERNE